MKKKFFIFIAVLVLSCQKPYSFKLIQSEYLTNLNINGILVNFEYFKILDAPPFIARICVSIKNSKNRVIQPSDEIKIQGTYFYCTNVYYFGLLDKSLESPHMVYSDPEDTFSISSESFNLEFVCHIKKNETASLEDLELLKHEKFEVVLPAINIDGKKYNFKQVEFIPR